MISNERTVVVVFSTIVNRYYTSLRCIKIHTPQRSMKRNKLYCIVGVECEKDCVWREARIRTQRQQRHTRRRAKDWSHYYTPYPNLAPTGRIFMKFNVWVFLENLRRKFRFRRNVTRITGTFHEGIYIYIYMIISCSARLRLENVLEKGCRENKITHFMFNDPPPPLFLPKIMLFEIMWKKCCRVGQSTDDNIIWKLHFLCWITKATNTHSEYVIRLFHGNSSCTNMPSVTLYVCCLSCYYLFIVIETWTRGFPFTSNKFVLQCLKETAG